MNALNILEIFRKVFGSEAVLYAAPGRINLIGEHTDYNGGFVLPGAVDKKIYCAIKSNGLSKIRAYAVDPDQFEQFTLETLPTNGWAKYIYGMCRELTAKGTEIPMFDIVFGGDVPLGAGMSSSAALECCVGYALNDYFSLGLDTKKIALAGQATEHKYVGVKCGIMDQFISCFGKKGSLLKLDCRSLDYEYIPFNPKGYKLVLLNTGVSHELASSAYNRRRESCENVVKEINKNHPEVKFLRDADMRMLTEAAPALSAEDVMRATYVIEEIERVNAVCDALKKDDYERVGQMMYQTHKGLSELYEVSCSELDFLNAVAEESGVTGSRVMGGGFGGCTINLVKENLYGDFIKSAMAGYLNKFGKEPAVYDVVISSGACRVEV